MELAEVEQLYLNSTEKNREIVPVHEWKETGFDLEKSLNETKGTFIEIAGPTPFYNQLENREKLTKPIFVSNLAPGVPLYNPFTGEYVGIHGTVDFQADSRKLPVEDGSVGAIFASCLPREIINDTVEEIGRTVEPGGIVVWQGENPETAVDLASKGFSIKSYQKFDSIDRYTFNFVFQRKSGN